MAGGSSYPTLIGVAIVNPNSLYSPTKVRRLLGADNVSYIIYMESSSDDIRDRLASLVAVYTGQLPQRMEEIRSAYEASWDGGFVQASFEELRLYVHKLAGSGATFGFDGITATARSLEAVLDGVLKSSKAPSHAIRKTIENKMKKLENEATPETKEDQKKDFEARAEEMPQAVVATPSREILFVTNGLKDEGQKKELKDLSDQLGFFGFQVLQISSLEELGKAIDGNKLAIIHTDFIWGDEELQQSVADYRKGGEDSIRYIFISHRTDFGARLAALRAGADAYFTIPVDIARLLDMIDTLTSEEKQEPYHILIVDDDPDQVSYYALVLQQAGMITSVASDPKTVLDILVEAKPELILMDLYMPECNGTELLSIIRQQEVFVGIPIVFLSVEEDKQKKLDAIRYGGDDFLTKPVDPEYLITSISNRVSRTRNMRFFMERDSLTGLLNHSNLREHLTREILRATRAQSNLCFAMIDLDHFKLVNDTHGHLIGDKVLKSLSRMLQERLRRTDIIGRYGGEEFGVILLNTDGNNGERILNEVRNNFSRIHHQAEDEEFFVTFSCGIACFSAFQDARSITNAADRALYEAKEGGRNRVALAGS